MTWRFTEDGAFAVQQVLQTDVLVDPGRSMKGEIDHIEQSLERLLAYNSSSDNHNSIFGKTLVQKSRFRTSPVKNVIFADIPWASKHSMHFCIHI